MSHHITVIYMIIYANVTSSENSVSHHLKINQFLGKKQNIIPVFLKNKKFAIFSSHLFKISH